MNAATLASSHCYSCEGSGKIIGHGCDGLRCPCIASCVECGEDFAWTHDDEKAPKNCPRCSPTNYSISLSLNLQYRVELADLERALMAVLDAKNIRVGGEFVDVTVRNIEAEEDL